MPTGWRIVKARHAASAFDGEGARLHGGRWNSPGTAVVYTAESASLAALELLVHLQSAQLLSSYVSIRAHFERRLVEAIEPASLPRDWQRYPATSALQEIGDRWAAAGRSAVLRVPSAVVPGESNYLLNPNHAAFARIRIDPPSPFAFDPRLG